MSNLRLLFILLIISNLGCNWINPIEDVPAFISIGQTAVNIEPGQLDIRNHSLKAIYTYRQEEPIPIGVLGNGSKIPLNDLKPLDLYFRGAIFENGSSSLIKEYPFWQTIQRPSLPQKGKIEYYDLTFEYYPDSVLAYPVNEGFEGQSLQLEAFGAQANPAVLIRTAFQQYQGGYGGFIQFDDGKINYQAQSTNVFSLPSSGSPVWLEIAYKTTLAFQLGLVAEKNGNVTVLNQNTLIPKDQWNVAFLNFTPLSSAYSGYNFRLWIGANGEGKQQELLIDRIRLIHFK
ncbi:MAG: hypothetical protein EBS07_07395 [Sphingobacteriia bacterium]|nr:hypothetical protein [Sphingobacteriia bacterium]